ncbi:hypothetical protein [Gynuella sunshinyii]|uniref:Uncharacterized protein n=1 Tax=Gynuella sunshinyii YC6258 TaxID=1445510 RepID=A0A0C5VPM5_9GAMM|nr:hypothetical protein [Gynuella sunshinyii]AJQ92204.1 hypothetical Protein YC6258_00150 [Gynuella sunshinyii YC6258]
MSLLALPIAKIKAAQALIPSSSELRKQHEQGLEMLLMSTEQLINNISSTDIIVNCYIFAKFIKAAHEGKFIEFEASGASVEEAKFIQMKIALKKKMVLKKRKSL